MLTWGSTDFTIKLFSKGCIFIIQTIKFYCRLRNRTIKFYKKGLERNNLTAEYNIWGNLLGFVPFGILLPLAIPFFQRWWIIIPAGLLLSLGFETVQLLTGLGVWDVDDLLLNT